MDKQTEIMWEAEFVKQYPKPEDSRWWPRLASKELSEANKSAIRARVFHWYEDGVVNSRNLEDYVNFHYREHLRKYSGNKSTPLPCAWGDWKKECYDRFNAIFSAEPTYALEELRKGNLLIEGNV